MQTGESGDIRFVGPFNDPKIGWRLRRPDKKSYIQHAILSILVGSVVVSVYTLRGARGAASSFLPQPKGRRVARLKQSEQIKRVWFMVI